MGVILKTGFDEGRNIIIEYRSADGNYDRLPGLVDELINLRVTVLYRSGGSVSALAAKDAARGVAESVLLIIGQPCRSLTIKS